jgi:hypothetical protein
MKSREAQRRWNGYDSKKKKIIIAPGGGFPEKCWGDKNFNLLTNLLLSMEIFRPHNYRIKRRSVEN